MVAVVARSWRPFAAPAAFLAAVTIAVIGARALWPHHAPKAAHPRQHRSKAPALHPRPARFYRVRAGDTLASIATRTHTPLERLRRLNPNVQPTALFIGQRLRLG